MYQVNAQPKIKLKITYSNPTYSDLRYQSYNCWTLPQNRNTKNSWPWTQNCCHLTPSQQIEKNYPGSVHYNIIVGRKKKLKQPSVLLIIFPLPMLVTILRHKGRNYISFGLRTGAIASEEAWTVSSWVLSYHYFINNINKNDSKDIFVLFMFKSNLIILLHLFIYWVTIKLIRAY